MNLSTLEKGYISNAISDIFSKFKQNNEKFSDILFNINDSFKIICKAKKILANEPAILEINTKSNIRIVGDIHGNLESLISIFNNEGGPEKTQYLFLGDYVDRGNYGCEVMIMLYAYKILYPNKIFLIRGNHEFDYMTECYGFKEECYKRVKIVKNEKILYGGKAFYKEIIETFNELPICAILNKKTFCVHGGITALINSRDELMSISKVGSTFSSENSVQAEFLWNDPDNNVLMYSKGHRGLGCLFGYFALKEFLDIMKFDKVIRGHQMECNGYNWPFGKYNGMLTVFSSFDYCGTSNDGAIAIMSENGDVEIRTIVPQKALPSNDTIECNFTFLDGFVRNPNIEIDNMPRLIEF